MFKLLTIVSRLHPNVARGTRASETCYGEYGCFTTASPFGELYFPGRSAKSHAILD